MADSPPRWVNKTHTVLHKALAQAVGWSLVPRSVTEAVKTPKPTTVEMDPLSKEETRSLLAVVRGDRLEALYVLAVTTGMRLGELLGLKWPDVATPWPSPSTPTPTSSPTRGTTHQSPHRRPKLTGCSTVAVRGPVSASRPPLLVRRFTCKMPLFSRGRCWVRTSVLLLVS